MAASIAQDAYNCAQDEMLCADIANECEKYLGRKMDGEGLYKYVCDALQAARDSH